MKIFPPRQGSVLFTLPAISEIQRYLWISKKPGQRRKEAALWGFIMFLPFVVANVSSLIRYNWADWVAVTVVFAALFSMIYRSSKFGLFWPAVSRNHLFFANSAHVFTGRSKRGYSPIIPERVRSIRVRQALFEGRPFNLYIVEFKDTVPGWLPNYDKPQFGIPASVDLTPFTDWLSHHCLTLERED